MNSRPIPVFVSHAWDSQNLQRRDQVRALAELLAASGIDVRLDLYMQHRLYEWPTFVVDQLAEVDYVIVVASPLYRQRAEAPTPPGRGQGVAFEAAMLRDRITNDRQLWSSKIITVLLPGTSSDDIPQFLSPSARIWYPIRELTARGIEAVLRVLHAKPKYPPPVIGPIPHLPPVPSALDTLGLAPPD